MSYLAIPNGPWSPTIAYAAKDVDLKTVAATTITTTRADLGRFVVISAWVLCKTVSGLVTAATVSIGQNSATYNDIVGAGAIAAALSVANLYVPLTLVAAPISVPASTAIKGNVTIGAVATAMTGDFWVVGFYAG